MFHREVIGVDGDNLDPFFSGRDELRSALASCGHDSAVLEGAMGIYDGIAGEAYKGSCYEVACMTDTPIVLLVNAKGMGTTLISVIRGILSDDREGRIRGLILNRISERYYERLRPLLEEMLAEAGTEKDNAAELLGFVPESKDINLESRHLGLMLPDETAGLEEQICTAAGLINDHVDMKALRAIMASAPELEDAEDNISPDAAADKLKIAVAYDEAFCFYYKANLKEFEKHGIEPVRFSPVYDDGLPEGVSGILLGGGYPELYAEQLSSNTGMLESIREAISSGMPSLAECGGFMYLLESLAADDSKAYKMAGVLSGESHNTKKLTRFGYITIREKKHLCAAGTLLTGLAVKGHEFHYYDSDNNGSNALAVKPGSGKTWECMHAGEEHLWGYPHLYYPSCPELISRFRAAMLRYKKREEAQHG